MVRDDAERKRFIEESRVLNTRQIIGDPKILHEIAATYSVTDEGSLLKEATKSLSNKQNKELLAGRPTNSYMKPLKLSFVMATYNLPIPSDSLSPSPHPLFPYLAT